MTKFLDNFWDPDFNSTNGFEVLVKRMKDGRETCKALEELLKQRAKAEDTYGKTLQRMAKSALGKEEIGGLRKSWDEMLTQTEHMGNCRIQLGVKLAEEAKKIEDFREAQREKRRRPEENTKKAAQAKKDWYQRVIQAKKAYETRKKDFDIADENYMKQRLVLAPKEVEKLMQKKERSAQAVEQADAQYTASVKSLDDARKEWEKQMEECCVILQTLDEERIRFLRNMMWIHFNLLSDKCVEDDSLCEEGRKVLENCSEESDIKLFVAQKRTGGSRPAPIDIEVYRGIPKSSASPNLDANRRRDPHTALPLIPTNSVNPGNVHQPANLNTPHTHINGNRRSLPKQPDNDVGDPLYAAVDTPPPSSTSQNMVRVCYDYKAQGPKELSLTVGQTLLVLNSDDRHWWRAELNGKRGLIPTQYVTPINLVTENTLI